MYAWKVVLTWVAILLPTWLYLPLWFMIGDTFWTGFGMGSLTQTYLLGQATILLFAKQSKYI